MTFPLANMRCKARNSVFICNITWYSVVHSQHSVHYLCILTSLPDPYTFAPVDRPSSFSSATFSSMGSCGRDIKYTLRPFSTRPWTRTVRSHNPCDTRYIVLVVSITLEIVNPNPLHPPVTTATIPFTLNSRQMSNEDMVYQE